MSVTLIDTSVWRHYFAGSLAADAKALLDGLLNVDDAVACHPAVVGELVLGGLSSLAEELIMRLPSLAEINSAELLAFIAQHTLARRGIGWVDLSVACEREGRRCSTMDAG